MLVVLSLERIYRSTHVHNIKLHMLVVVVRWRSHAVEIVRRMDVYNFVLIA